MYQVGLISWILTISVDQSTNASTSLGGATAAPAGKTYIYQMSSNEWVAVDDMPTPRYYLMCGLVTDSNGAQRVIAAGGCNDSVTSLDTVEIFSVEDKSWTTSKKSNTCYKLIRFI